MLYAIMSWVRLSHSCCYTGGNFLQNLELLCRQHFADGGIRLVSAGSTFSDLTCYTTKKLFLPRVPSHGWVKMRQLQPSCR
jgi:hypothetical protein